MDLSDGNSDCFVFLFFCYRGSVAASRPYRFHCFGAAPHPEGRPEALPKEAEEIGGPAPQQEGGVVALQAVLIGRHRAVSKRRIRDPCRRLANSGLRSGRRRPRYLASEWSSCWQRL